MPAGFEPPEGEDMSPFFLDDKGECSIRSVQRKVDAVKDEVGPKFYVRSDTKSKEAGRVVYYEFKDAKAVEEKEEEEQLHEDAARVTELSAEYDELLKKENEALVCDLPNPNSSFAHFTMCAASEHPPSSPADCT